jgi:hypothetical protein
MLRRLAEVIRDSPEQRGPLTRGHLVGLVLWCSFLAASVGTLVLFAALDPHSLRITEGTSAWAAFWADANAVYALGFFFCWCVATLAAALTAFMIRSENWRPGPRL